MPRPRRSKRATAVVVKEQLPVEIPSSTADSVAVLTQEKQERKNQDADVDMKLDGEETEESQTLLDIRREAAEALAREDEEEEGAPPSSQPRPVAQESTQDDEEQEAAEDEEDENEGESFDGEYSYADLSENFSAQDGEETEGLDLEAFEYDPKDKDFLEELLAVAPEEEKELLRRLSVANVGEEVRAEETATTTTAKPGMSARAQEFLPLANKYMRGRTEIWQHQRNKYSRPKFNKMVFAYATEQGKLSTEDAAAVARAMSHAWATAPKLVAKRTQQAKEKEDIMEAAAKRRLEKAMAHKEMLREERRLREEEEEGEKKHRPRRSKQDYEADVQAEREEAAAQLAVEEALKSLEEAKMRALRKRKRTPEEDEEQNESTSVSATKSKKDIAKPATSNSKQQHSPTRVAEARIKLIEAQNWYGELDTREEKTEEAQMPAKKRARRGHKKGPAVSAHFPATSAKTTVSKAAPTILATTEDVVMDDASENASDISAVEVKQPALQKRDSSIIGNTADDEDRPITFSGGAGNIVERVLRTEEIIKPISIQPSVLTHQIEESKVRVPTQTEIVNERSNKVIRQEKRLAIGSQLRQQALAEEMAIKKMAGAARHAVQAAKRTVEETVKQNKLNMPDVPDLKVLEKEARTLEWKAKSIEDRNNSRMKRPRNNNKLKVQPPILSKDKAKANLPNVGTPKVAKKVPVVDNEAKLEFLAAKERQDNDPAIVAKRLAEGLSAKGKQPRKTRGGKGKDPKATPAASAPTPTQAVNALVTKSDANSEKVNADQTVKKSRRGGKNKAAKVDAVEVPKDHHS